MPDPNITIAEHRAQALERALARLEAHPKPTGDPVHAGPGRRLLAMESA